MKKRLATTLLAGAMSASMVIPAFATAGDGTVVPSDSGTEVWAGIVIQDKDPIIKVEVPTLFAFVVNGTTDTSDSTVITKDAGTLYLPNVKVEVTTPSSVDDTTGAVTNGEYNLNYTSDGVMRMRNYSTYAYMETDSAGNDTIVTRQGLELTINGEIQESSATASAKNFWEYSTTAATGNEADFKKYSLSIDDIPLTTGSANGFKMASDITLAAPDTDPTVDSATDTVSYTNLNSSNLASSPTEHEAAFGVTIGGLRGQYNQVEESAKIGTIVWTVSADVSVTDRDVQTAPDNDYLALDPDDLYNTTPTAP